MRKSIKTFAAQSAKALKSTAKATLDRLPPHSKKTAKKMVVGVVGRLPRPASRLTGALAVHGGTPVRHPKFQPWPDFPSTSMREWTKDVRPALRQVFLSGIEGLPQPL